VCGQLILRKISTSDATRCQILRLKCTEFDFRWSSAPYPAWGAYNAPQARPLAVFKGAYFYGEGKGRRRAMEGERMGKERGRHFPDQCQTASCVPAT